MNEISVNVSLSVNKNGAFLQKNAGVTMDMAGSQIVGQTQSIGTGSWTAIELGNLVGNPAKLLIKNLDTTNYVELATDNAGVNKTDKIVKQDFVVRSPVGTIYAKANTAAVLIEIAAMDA